MVRSLKGVRRAHIYVGDQVRKNFHLTAETEFPVFASAEIAESDKDVDVLKLSFQVVGEAPQLRWPFMTERAREAFTSCAQFAIVAP